MANGYNLFISYDLIAPTKNYPVLAEAIQKLGAAVRPNLSYWFVDSSRTAEEAAKLLWAVMDANDKLVVVDTRTNNAFWYNIDQQITAFMQARWNH